MNRLVFSYTMAFSLILLVILTLIYFILNRNVENEARLNNQMLINQPVRQLERLISEMDNMAYNVMINEQLIQKFSALRGEDTPGNHYERDILDNIDTGSILTTINGRFSPVWRISAYNDRGDYIYTGALVDAVVVNRVLEERDVGATMEHFRTASDPRLLSPPEKDGWSHYFKSNYITLTRPIMNVYSRDVVGLVEVQQNSVMLEQYLALSSERTLYLNVYDAQGAPVLLQGSDGDVVVASAVSDEYGWSVELLEPAYARLHERLQLLAVMVAAWLALSVVLYVVSNLIASSLSRPLTNLTNAVSNIDITAPNRLEVPEAGIDEVVSLQDAFNTMLDRLTLSMDQEKKSFLLAMQAQMNPHFLYNVLSVVNAVALEKRSDKVVQICGNLSSMLRYSSSYVKGVASVREELRHTVSYLDLMKARYDYMFQYTVEIDPALEEVVIPKLVIQPLCENCFMHAFSNMEPPYRIDIRLQGDESGWSVQVTDNGAGFSEEERLRILEHANLASYEDLSKMQMGGLGLVSSVVRMKLMLRKEVRCDVQPVQPQGACVTIHISQAQ